MSSARRVVIFIELVRVKRLSSAIIMSTESEQISTAAPTAAQSTAKSARLLGAAALLSTALLVGCSQKPDAPPAASAPPATQTNASPPTAAPKPEFAKLPGKWQRADGDYLIEIKGADSAGTLNVAYFNPNPIHVSRAAAMVKEGSTKVFVELQDVNYPGSTYSLSYDPQSDQLYGQYYQAALQQTFDVTFARIKEP